MCQQMGFGGASFGGILGYTFGRLLGPLNTIIHNYMPKGSYASGNALGPRTKGEQRMPPAPGSALLAGQPQAARGKGVGVT